MSLSDEPQSGEEASREARKQMALKQLRDSHQQLLEMKQKFQQGTDFSSPEHSQVWAHWEYSPEEWKRFDRIDWRAQRLRFTFWLWVLLAGIIISLAVLPVTLDPTLSLPEGLPIVGIAGACVCFTLLILHLVYHFAAYSEAKKRHKARLKLPRTVTLSGGRLPERVIPSYSANVWVAGTYFPLDSTELFLPGKKVALKQVTLTTEPPVLHFHLKKEDDEAAWWHFTFRLLIPRGHEGEAEPLLERFQTEVIQVLLHKKEEEKRKEERRLNPPEPKT